MAEQQAETAAVEEQTAAQTTQPGGGEQPEAQVVRHFTQAEVDKLISERLEREKGKAQKAAEAARTEAERKAAEEQGEFKKLYEQVQAELKTQQERAKALELSSQRREVAEKVGLPGALADRLRGETPEEMEQDAKAMLAALPKPTAPNINGAPVGGKPAGGVYTDAERVRLASIYGVSPRHFGTSGG